MCVVPGAQGLFAPGIRRHISYLPNQAVIVLGCWYLLRCMVALKGSGATRSLSKRVLAGAAGKMYMT